MSKSVHLSLTPLAGSPISIVDALNSYTSFSARHVVLAPNAYGARTFKTDLVWKENREEALEVLSAADVVVLHHYIQLRENPFGVDFTKIVPNRTRFLRQFHTSPQTIARQYGLTVRAIIDDALPQTVMAQYHERLFPNARVVPLIVPLNAELYRPSASGGREVVVYFSPTFSTSAWRSRWDTKGFPETMRLLKRLRRQVDSVRTVVDAEAKHIDSLARRRASDIVIDEMATGSFHTSSLESLSQGKPTFAYLDDRTKHVVEELTGSKNLPWLNFRVEECEPALRRVAVDFALRETLGNNGRRWMEQYYRDDRMIEHYTEALTMTMEGNARLCRPRFDTDDQIVRWFIRDSFDLAWEGRRNMRRPRRGWITAIKGRLGHAVLRWRSRPRARRRRRPA